MHLGWQCALKNESRNFWRMSVHGGSGLLNTLLLRSSLCTMAVWQQGGWHCRCESRLVNRGIVIPHPLQAAPNPLFYFLGSCFAAGQNTQKTAHQVFELSYAQYHPRCIHLHQKRTCTDWAQEHKAKSLALCRQNQAGIGQIHSEMCYSSFACEQTWTTTDANRRFGPGSGVVRTCSVFVQPWFGRGAQIASGTDFEHSRDSSVGRAWSS